VKEDQADVQEPVSVPKEEEQEVESEEVKEQQLEVKEEEKMIMKLKEEQQEVKEEQEVEAPTEMVSDPAPPPIRTHTPASVEKEEPSSAVGGTAMQGQSVCLQSNHETQENLHYSVPLSLDPTL
jgi:hypothetical protein